MSLKITPPSIQETAFDCPHCGAYTTQYWFKLRSSRYSEDHRTPILSDPGMRESISAMDDLPEEKRQSLLTWVDRLESGLVFLEETDQGSFSHVDVNNLNLSQCYNCKKIAVWVHQSLVSPQEKIGVAPNLDLPDAILHDFNEAREILNQSPRGAAALLRLCVQKLCAFLGEKGKNIDDDIASLVSKGLNPLVQQSLDVVRVIGNEAVHPGVIDLKDDRDTALKLLQIINLIADQMITHPKTIKQLYENLPADKKKAIEKRNKNAIKE